MPMSRQPAFVLAAQLNMGRDQPARMTAARLVLVVLRDKACMQGVIHKASHSTRSGADLAFWLSRSIAERIAAVEVLRQQVFAC